MLTKRNLQLAGLNLGIIFFNILLFGPMGVSLDGSNALLTALGGTAIFMSILVFLYGNYRLLTKREKTVDIRDIMSPEDCETALNQADGKRTFDSAVVTMQDQLLRLVKRKEKLKTLLIQKFTAMNLQYEKYDSAILDMEYLFYANIKSILHKINAFDQEDYQKLQNSRVSGFVDPKYRDARMGIHNEYISFVKNTLEKNEEVILRLDTLLLEISKLDATETDSVENLVEMKNMDELLKKTNKMQ